MFKASHCIAIALAFLVAASLRASAGERTVSDAGRDRVSAATRPVQASPHRPVPWRLVFR